MPVYAWAISKVIYGHNICHIQDLSQKCLALKNFILLAPPSPLQEIGLSGGCEFERRLRVYSLDFELPIFNQFQFVISMLELSKLILGQ